MSRQPENRVAVGEVIRAHILIESLDNLLDGDGEALVFFWEIADFASFFVENAIGDICVGNPLFCAFGCAANRNDDDVLAADFLPSERERALVIAIGVAVIDIVE